MELRSEATAELSAARAKEDRLRSLEAARAEAEARAAAHAADAEICRLQVRARLHACAVCCAVCVCVDEFDGWLNAGCSGGGGACFPRSRHTRPP